MPHVCFFLFSPSVHAILINFSECVQSPSPSCIPPRPSFTRFPHAFDKTLGNLFFSRKEQLFIWPPNFDRVSRTLYTLNKIIKSARACLRRSVHDLTKNDQPCGRRCITLALICFRSLSYVSQTCIPLLQLRCDGRNPAQWIFEDRSSFNITLLNLIVCNSHAVRNVIRSRQKSSLPQQKSKTVHFRTAAIENTLSYN